MNITLFETNKKKLKLIQDKLNMIIGNLSTEIRIQREQRDRLDKISLSVDGTNLDIEELSKMSDRLKFLDAQRENLLYVLKRI